MADTVVDPLEALYEKGTLLRPLDTAEDKYERELELRAQKLNPLEIAGTAFAAGANTAYNVYQDFERKSLAGDADPLWDDKAKKAWLDERTAEIPVDRQWHWMTTRNTAEAQLMLDDYNSAAEANALLEKTGGFTSFTAQALAGLVDLDAPLALLSGGTSLGIKGGLMSTRLGRMAAGGLLAGTSNAALMAVDYSVNPNTDWTSIPTAGLLGAGLGMIPGLVSPRAFNDANDLAVQEFNDALEGGIPTAERGARFEFVPDESPYVAPAREPTDAPAAQPQAFSVGQSSGSSVGAQQANVPQWQQAMQDPDQIAVVSLAQQRYQSLGLSGKFEGAWDRLEEAAPGVAQAARVFERALQASPLGSVYSKLQNSPSYVAKMLGYDLMVSPGGIAANARAGALLKQDYENQLRGVGIPAYVDSYTAWAAAQGRGSLERNLSRRLKQDFDTKVAEELQARRYDAIYDFRRSDPHVRAAADAHDAFSKRELEISKGREGEGSVKGWEDVQWQPGYMAQRWSGRKMNDLLFKGAITEDGLIDLLKRSYLKFHPGMTPDEAKIYATAVIHRARTTDRGVNTNLIGILQEDGADYLFDVLVRNGVSKGDASKLVDKLTSRLETKSQQGQTKQRIDVDLREQDVATGVRLMDIIDTNLMDNMARRARGASGRAALARKGVYSPQDRDRLITTVLNEQLARKGQPPIEPGFDWRERADAILWDEKDLTREQLEDYFTFFGEGAIGGGISAGYSRAMKLTNLALLNGLGLTQLAETGPMLAAFGWEKFMYFAGDSLKASLKNSKSELIQELEHMHIMVPEHRLYRDDMTHEFEKGTAQNEFWSLVDHGLNQASRLQGYMTGFYKIKEMQQRIAVTAGADKIMTFLGLYSHQGTMSAARLEELGLSADLQRRLQSYIQRGIVEFRAGVNSGTAKPAPSKRGFYQPPDPLATEGVLNTTRLHLHKLNFDQWDPKDVEEFTAALNLLVHRQVQKSFAGETSMIFHKDGLMSLFLHLKSFPLLAMTKQTMRHARIADSEALASLTYGLMTAGAVYAAKQALNGNTENIEDPVKLMKGAFGMSNLTGWFPMFSDPLANMLGMDSLKFNEYSRGIDGNVIGIPAAFPTLNKMANIPGAVLSPLTSAVGLGDAALDNNDINALRTTPIIGNYYGMTMAWNIAKEENRKTAREERAKQRAAEREGRAVPPLPEAIQSLLN